ncbi:MAG: helix-turn-helix domain-containing protein [Maribacter sp.]|nr:helix-turn-helix domain-containing protein [Maribacter sp.]
MKIINSKDLLEVQHVLNSLGYEVFLKHLGCGEILSNINVFFREEYQINTVEFSNSLLDYGESNSEYGFFFTDPKKEVRYNGMKICKPIVLLMPPKVEIMSKLDKTKYTCLSIPKKIGDAYLKLMDIDPTMGEYAKQSRYIELKQNKLNRYLHLFRHHFIIQNSSYLDFSIAMEELTSELFDMFYLKPTEKEHNETSQKRKVLKTLKFFESHHHQELTLERISEELHISPRNLQRYFKNYLNTSPLRALQIIRINKLKTSLLQIKGKTITDLSYDIGFNHIGRTIQLYKSFYGLTPKQDLISL